MPVAGHISVERSTEGQRVVEAHFPDAIAVNDVKEVNRDMVVEWSLRFSNVCLILIGSGPPCQGVSGLNSDRRGALRDERSCLFQEIPRITTLVREAFPWAQIHNITESVASMDAKDCQHMNDGLGCEPWYVDSGSMTLCNRPRVYWLSWDPHPGIGSVILEGRSSTSRSNRPKDVS